MDAIYRVVEGARGAACAVARRSAAGMLIVVLSACSMLHGQPRGGASSIGGAVLSDDYALAIAGLAGEEASTLTVGRSADSSPAPGSLGFTPRAAHDASRHPGTPAARGVHVPGQVLVQYRSGAGGPWTSPEAARGTRARVVEVGPDEDTGRAVERLSRDPAVLLASPNYYVYPTSLPDDPFLPQQWGLPAAGLPATWQETTGEVVTVAVIDSGFDLRHADLRGVFLPGYDFCGNDDCTASDSDAGAPEDNWHGTHVAGIIAAIGNNGAGVKGVADSANVRILPVKVFNDGGWGGNTEGLIRAMRWAAGLPVEDAPANPHPARVINLSLAGDFPSEVLQPTIDAVRARGTLVVASTGNAGIDRVMSPAAAAGVIGVGSINSAFRRSCFSNHGVGPNGPGGVDLLAPGGEADGSVVACGVTTYEVEGLLSTIPGDAYGSAVGTSMAAPMVSGVAAVILARYPSLSVDELESLLLSSAYFDSTYMNEPEYGAGIVRADKALGFIGPGDRVLVELTEQESGAARGLPLTLGPSVAGEAFSFDGIEPGSYELRARDPKSGLVFASRDVRLYPGAEVRVDLVLVDPR